MGGFTWRRRRSWTAVRFKKVVRRIVLLATSISRTLACPDPQILVCLDYLVAMQVQKYRDTLVFIVHTKSIQLILLFCQNLIKIVLVCLRRSDHTLLVNNDFPPSLPPAQHARRSICITSIDSLHLSPTPNDIETGPRTVRRSITSGCAVQRDLQDVISA